jgi:ATP-binding cassette subfamily F protein 3
MSSKEVLLDALRKYDGTIVFVSHDREFIEHLATRVVELAPDRDSPERPSVVRDFPGDYAYYAWRLAREAGDEDGSDLTVAPERTAAGTHAESIPHEELKRRRGAARKLEREIDEAFGCVEELEARKTALHTELSKPEIYADGDEAQRVTAELATVETELERATHRWEELVAEHERLAP